MARTRTGRIELFLAGHELHPGYPRVRKALEYQAWYRNGSELLEANRLLLPAAGHFNPVAAFLCTELLRCGADEDLAAAFAKVEPLIEMAIEGLLLADEAITGLCGELLVLEAMLAAVPLEQKLDTLGSWVGYGETPRDFQLPWAGIEVKTTTSLASSHLFSGIHQLEPGHGVGGVQETQFHIASIGIEWADEPDEGTSTLSALVDRLLAAIRPFGGESAVQAFLGHVAAYGGSNGAGYDHLAMAGLPQFNRPFRVTFARSYDMSDPVIHLLTTDDLRARPFIDGDSVRLRVSFPNKVTGDLNPVVGLSAIGRQPFATGSGSSDKPQVP